MRRIVLAFFFSGLLGAFTLPIASGAEPRIWLLDEEFSWMDRRSADQLIATAKSLGVNAIVPCVWHGRGVTWKSRYPKEPRWTDNVAGLRDPLDYLVKRAHEAGLEVHPWFTVTLRQRDFLHEYWGDGVPDKAFDVHNDQFRRFIADVVLEVVRNYPIDGVTLDYVRSRGICTSETCEASYHVMTGRSLRVDNLSYKVSGDARTSIERWNASAVDDLIQIISTEVRRARPGVLVSVASHAAAPQLLLQGTDSIKWANAGLIDYILHIEYARVPAVRRELLRSALERLADPGKLVMIAGNFERDPKDRARVIPRDPLLVADAVRFARTFNPAQPGFAIYEYRFLTPEQVNLVRKEAISAGAH